MPHVAGSSPIGPANPKLFRVEDLLPRAAIEMEKVGHAVLTLPGRKLKFSDEFHQYRACGYPPSRKGVFGMRHLSAVMMVLAVSLACTKKPEQEIVTTPKPSGPPASIGGTVRYRADREVIEITGLEVSLKRGNETVGTATTDEFGTFHFDGMAPGTYTACWSGNGWENGCTEP